jgi:catechol 2,3-dioxygenase-like lactoylglutathione lyase family enzyme
MLDHVGFPVSDYARSKAFYLRALAPLGYGLAMEVSPEQTGGGSQGGFGPPGRSSGSAPASPSKARCISPSWQKTGRPCAPFMTPR